MAACCFTQLGRPATFKCEISMRAPVSRPMLTASFTASSTFASSLRMCEEYKPLRRATTRVISTISSVGVKRPGLYSRPVERPIAPWSIPSSTARISARNSSASALRSSNPTMLLRNVPCPNSIVWLIEILRFSSDAKYEATSDQSGVTP